MARKNKKNMSPNKTNINNNNNKYQNLVTDISTHAKDRLSLTLYWSLKSIISIGILYVAYFLGHKLAFVIVNEVKKHASEHKKLIIRQLADIVFYAVFGFGVFVSLINLGVQSATIITLMGTGLVTLGLAMQSSLSNVFAGIYVALSENFQIGDTIRVYVPYINPGPIEGKVVDFNIAYIKMIDSRTNKMMFLPNSSVASNVLVNLSRAPTNSSNN